jgi:TetR/AcrR family transcriptional regulator, transcriptional repressor for nem operon
MADPHHESKAALLNAAISVIRIKGYAATRVEDICAAAELTKGSFFHHFKTKEDLAVAAAAHWSTGVCDLFTAAAYRKLPDPLDRLLGYVDLRKSILKGTLPEFSCFAGTMIQEIYETHPAIRDACEKSITAHVAFVRSDIEDAMRRYCVDPPFSADSLASYIQAVIQGAIILAKANQDPTACLDHLRRYVEMLFTSQQPTPNASPRLQ